MHFFILDPKHAKMKASIHIFWSEELILKHRHNFVPFGFPLGPCK